MNGGDFMDCNSFFDQMDDLVEFPADTDSGIWSNPLPYEDIAQLEWLSNFVEDSFSGEGLTITKESNVPNKESSSGEFQTLSPISSGSFSIEEKTFPPSPTQRGIRTKRPRPTTFKPPSFPISIVSSENENIINSQSVITDNSVHKTPTISVPKKKKIKLTIKSASLEVNNGNCSSENVRKCLHCEISKTPQWRSGPMGPKTLCNACGVRYKLGRLFPEYRPAASPTFVASLHSNSHRKVLEMRTGCEERSTIDELIPNTNPSFDCI